jgi:hypothetical protein
MLFTWNTTNLCIVFEGWRITGTGSLIASLIAIVLLTAGYEAVREASRRYEAHAARVAERGVRGGGEFLHFSLYLNLHGRKRRSDGMRATEWLSRQLLLENYGWLATW